MKIGQLASDAGVNIQTIRYYERRGLLPEAPRTTSGCRTYDPDAVARLRFIKRAQDLGFSLEEIAELLELRQHHAVHPRPGRVPEKLLLPASNRLATTLASRVFRCTLVGSVSASRSRPLTLTESDAMRRSSRCVAATVAVLVGVTLQGCGGDTTAPPPPPSAPTVTSVSVTPATHTFVALNKTVQLSASARDAGGSTISGTSFTWSSSDQAIATVSASGLVTGVNNGPATITATTDGVSGTAMIDVGQPVSSNGGNVSSADDGATLAFPQGAVNQPTHITIGDASGFPPDPGVVPGTVYEIGPSNTQFGVPVDLTIQYDPANLLAGVSETDLGLSKVVDGNWEAVSGSSVNAADNTVTASISSLSVWGLRVALVVPSAANDNYSTQPNMTLTIPGSDGLLGNDGLGLPDATFTSFGGGSLGGGVTDNQPGSSVAFAGGTLTVNADGGLTLETPTQAGTFTFMYRIANAAGSSDATVTIAVEAPQGSPDTYENLGNMAISVPASRGVLSNDPAGSVVAEVQGSAANVGAVVATDQGGLLHVESDGGFTYVTPVGFTGDDTFTYSLAEGGPPTTVTIAITDRVWFLDEIITGSRNEGTQRDPFTSAEAFGAVNGRGGPRDPTAGDKIYMRRGNYGSLTLLDNQFLVGEGAAKSFEELTGIVLPPFTESPPTGGPRPVISNINTSGNTNGITLASNNRIFGINVGDTPNGIAIADNGSSPSVFTIENVEILGLGAALRIRFGGPSTVGARMKFDNISKSGGPAEGIFLDNYHGSFDVGGSTSIDNATGTAIQVSNAGSGTFDFGFTRIAQNTVGGITNGLDLSLGNANATFTFGSLNVTTGDGFGLKVNGGTVNILGSENTIDATGGAALDANSTAWGGELTDFLLLKSVTSPTGGIVIKDQELPAGMRAAQGVVVNSTSPAIDVSGVQGSVTFTDLDIDNSLSNVAGIRLANSPQLNLITKRGRINSGSGIAFDARDVGLDVTLESVSSTGGSDNGINLIHTTGSFSITGDGATAGSGGTISNKSGPDGVTDQGIGIFMDGATDVSLSHMKFNDFSNFGIRGLRVEKLTLSKTVIDGILGNSAPNNEAAISFQDLFGAALFDDNVISGGFVYNLDVTNVFASQELDLTVRGGTIGLNDAVEGLDGIRGRSLGSVSVRFNFDGVEFEGARLNNIKCDARNDSSMECNVRDITSRNEHSSSFGSGVSITGEDNSVMTFDVSGTTLGSQTFTGAAGGSIEVGFSGNASGTGTIRSNMIGVPGVGGSGASSGIIVSARNNASHTVTIEDNTITDFSFGGISVNHFGDNPGGTGPQLNVTIIGNTIDNVASNAFAAMNASLGLFGSENGVACFDIRNNTFDVSGASSPGAPIFLGQSSGAAHFNFPGYGGSPHGEFPVTGPPGTASTDLKNFWGPSLGNVFIDGPNQVRSGVDASAVTGVTGSFTSCP